MAMSNRIEDYNHPDLLFPGKYLKAADLRGKDVTVEIASIEPRHELKGQRGTDYKPLVRMKGKDKAWVLNKTNAMIIAEWYGNEVTSWIGESVVLYPARVQVGGKTMDAIRVRTQEELTGVLPGNGNGKKPAGTEE